MFVYELVSFIFSELENIYSFSCLGLLAFSSYASKSTKLKQPALLSRMGKFPSNPKFAKDEIEKRSMKGKGVLSESSSEEE
ncbi:hypothetical protein MKW92_052649, partial [Papaver armeniacum]